MRTVETPLKMYEAEIRLSRTDEDGFGHTFQFVARFPSTDLDAAEGTAELVAYSVVEGLPTIGSNNDHGWKMARNAVGTIAEVG